MLIRGRWVHCCVHWGSFGSLGFIGFIHTRPGCRRVQLGPLKPTLVVFVIIRVCPGHRVHSGSLGSFVRSLGIVRVIRFIHVRPGGHRVHFGLTRACPGCRWVH